MALCFRAGIAALRVRSLAMVALLVVSGIGKGHAEEIPEPPPAGEVMPGTVPTPPAESLPAAPTVPAQAPAGGSLFDEYVKRATALFKEDRFIPAAEELQKAYLLRQSSILLFNIAQAYRRGNKPKPAAQNYRLFLEKEPRSQLAPEARGYLADMEALSQAEDRDAVAQEQLRREKEAAARAQLDLASTRQRAELAEQKERRPAYRRAWFWAVLATSVAAAGAGVALGVIFTRDPATEGGFVNVEF